MNEKFFFAILSAIRKCSLLSVVAMVKNVYFYNFLNIKYLSSSCKIEVICINVSSLFFLYGFLFNRKPKSFWSKNWFSFFFSIICLMNFPRGFYFFAQRTKQLFISIKWQIQFELILQFNLNSLQLTLLRFQTVSWKWMICGRGKGGNSICLPTWWTKPHYYPQPFKLTNKKQREAW